MKMNKTCLILILTIAGLFLSGTEVLSQQAAGQLYEKALYLEEAKGELQGAIDLYNRIAENRNADQSFQAKALLHMGLCYEKLGKQEAVKSYQRLVNNFPAQKNEVAIARERLARLMPIAEKVTKASLIPKFTKIEIPTKPGNGVLSPDGKNLAYISEKSLWIVPVHGKTNPDIAGEPVRLTDPIEIWDLANMCAVWSANGKWLAFYATENREDVIYILSANGGKPVKVPINQKRPDIGGYDYRMSLSPDGKLLAFVDCNQNNIPSIYTIPTDGGSQKKLTDLGFREPSFSPDGRFIAMVKIDVKDKLGNEIYIIPSTGGDPILISDDADVVKSPVWSPDGSMIAFLARKYEKGWANNSNELWIAAVDRNGKPTGLITKTELSNSTTSMLAGWSPDNKIGMWLSKPEKNLLYTVPATGGQAMQVTSKNSWMPCWSPDAKHLYFDGINTDNFAGLETVPVTGGEVLRIPIRFKETIQPEMPVGGISVSPDGQKIVFETYYNDVNDSIIQKKPEGFHHIITIPVNGGSPVELTTNPLPDGYPVWSPDGRYIAFLRRETGSIGNMYTIPAEGGTPKKVTSANDKITYGRIDWSPDGKWIGFFSADSTIKMIPAGGGNSKVVVKGVDANSHFGLSFSPEGNKIAYSNKEKLYVVDLNSGKKEEVRTGLDAVPTMPAWSPDGGKIAFSAYIEEETDLWFMEDFLPLEKLEQPRGLEIVKASKGITIKQVWTGSEVGDFHSVSADGKYLSFVARETGDLAIRNLETKENKLLTNEGCWNGPYYWSDDNLLTADGKKIVYSWYNNDDEYDLRLLEVNKSQPRIIYKPKTPEKLIPKLFYSDDKKVIVQRFMSSEPWYLATVNLENGDIVNQKDFEGNYSMKLAMSPDPKYFGFDFRNKNDWLRFDIHLLSTDGKEELPLVDHPANDRLIGWLPGKDEMLFTSDRSGSSDLWALNTAKLNEPGEPRLILKNVGDIYPLGFNNDGNLFYSVEFRKYNSYIVPIDQNEGKLQFQSRLPLFGSMRDPVWFADGVRLLYTEYSIVMGGLQAHTLILNNTETGNSRRLADNIACLTARLSPDEKSVLVFGYDGSRIKDKNYKGGVYKIDIGSGTPTEISVGHDASYPVEWDNNGENIFYISNTQIIRHNIKSGMENVIFEDEDLTVMTILKRSADGNHLFFDLQKGDKEKHLMSISFDGGGLRTISKLNVPFTHVLYKMLAFPTEGDCIYFSSGSVLWKIPNTGGNPEEIWHSDNPIAGFSIHPGGTNMVLSLYEREVEIRTIENLAQELEKLDKMDH